MQQTKGSQIRKPVWISTTTSAPSIREKRVNTTSKPTGNEKQAQVLLQITWVALRRGGGGGVKERTLGWAGREGFSFSEGTKTNGLRFLHNAPWVCCLICHSIGKMSRDVFGPRNRLFRPCEVSSFCFVFETQIRNPSCSNMNGSRRLILRKLVEAYSI